MLPGIWKRISSRTYPYAVLQSPQEVGVSQLCKLEPITPLQGLHPATGLALQQ
jgi:hypothetical protein